MCSVCVQEPVVAGFPGTGVAGGGESLCGCRDSAQVPAGLQSPFSGSSSDYFLKRFTHSLSKVSTKSGAQQSSWTPWILPSLPLPELGLQAWPTMPSFSVVLGLKLRSPCLCNGHFINRHPAIFSPCKALYTVTDLGLRTSGRKSSG